MKEKLNSSKGINEIIFPEILKSEKDKMDMRIIH